MNTIPTDSETSGLLAWIERSGNKLPDPVFIFVWCIIAIIAASIGASFFGVSAFHPTAMDISGNPITVSYTHLTLPTNRDV